MTWKNPKPIAVAVVPIRGKKPEEDGVLLIRRAGGEDGYDGMLALPGGYMELGESWQASVVRELLEETGITAWPEYIELLDVITSPKNGNLLVFGLVKGVEVDIALLKPTPEASEFVVTRTAEFDTKFSAHTMALRKYFQTWREIL